MAERTRSPLKTAFSWILGLLVAAGATLFALANKSELTVDLWPLRYVTRPLPVFAIVFAAVLAGFLFGGIVAWLGQGHRRAESRRRAREIDRLTRERDELQRKLAAAEAAKPADDETTRRQLVVADH